MILINVDYTSKLGIRIPKQVDYRCLHHTIFCQNIFQFSTYYIIYISGAEEVYTSTWFAYAALSFILDRYEPRKTTDSVSILCILHLISVYTSFKYFLTYQG